MAGRAGAGWSGLHLFEHVDAQKVLQADLENRGDVVTEEEAAHFERFGRGF